MLIDDVRGAINRLAPRGWKELMRLHGLDLEAQDLAGELLRPLVQAGGASSIDRTVAGFEDFSSNGSAAIEPGDPGRSLLFHALASPNVYPSPHGPRTDADFPTLLELDAIENYIYGVAKRRLSDLGDVVVAVFAHQYRPGSTSVHGKHADMAYSRTGIARIGTSAMHYDPLRRSFWADPAGGAPGVAVMPARYAAFLAERRTLGAEDAVVHPSSGPIAGDESGIFLVPVHNTVSEARLDRTAFNERFAQVVKLDSPVRWNDPRTLGGYPRSPSEPRQVRLVEVAWIYHDFARRDLQDIYKDLLDRQHNSFEYPVDSIQGTIAEEMPPTSMRGKEYPPSIRKYAQLVRLAGYLVQDGKERAT